MPVDLASNRDPENEVVAGYFHDTDKAEKAVEALRQQGFAQIGIASHDEKKAAKLADRTDARAGVAVSPGTSNLVQHAGEADYASADDIHATLLGAHVTPQQASYFENQVRKRGVLVTVATPLDRAHEAQYTLASAGADTGENAEKASALEEPPSTASESAPIHPLTAESEAPLTPEEAGEHTFELRGELLRVYKERVQRGEVRFRKEVVTEHRQVEVPVQHEQVVVEHLPASGSEPASSAPMGSGGEVRIPVSEEQVRVEKEPVVTEQVRVSKREVESKHPVQEDVRHEELISEAEGNLTPEEREALHRKGPRRAA